MRLICLFQIIEEKDKSTLTYPEPVPWPSLTELFVGNQHREQNPPPWPLQSVPLPPMVFMEIVGLQNRTKNPRTRHALHHPRLPRQHQEHLDQREEPGRCFDMLVGSGCCVKAKHKAYNVYTVCSLRAGELLLFQAVLRIYPLIIVIRESRETRMGWHNPPPYLEKASNASCMH